jgi:hypothetical protein
MDTGERQKQASCDNNFQKKSISSLPTAPPDIPRAVFGTTPVSAKDAPPAAIKLTSQLNTLLDMPVKINGVKDWRKT